MYGFFFFIFNRFKPHHIIVYYLFLINLFNSLGVWFLQELKSVTDNTDDDERFVILYDQLLCAVRLKLHTAESCSIE